MIITVTLNPLLEYRLFFSGENNFSDDVRRHRCVQQDIAAGGKGINVSRQLKNLGIDNTAVTFIGGLNGKQFSQALAKEKFNSIFVRTEAGTRIGFVAIENEKNAESFFGLNSAIEKKDAEQMKLKLEKMIPNCEMIILAGSSSSQATDDVFPFAIELANKHDKISILDTYGKHYSDCINASPKILHCTKNEIENSISISLKDENDIREYLLSLYEKGIKQIFITDGANNFYASNFDYHYKIVPPKINTIDSTGSGDAFTAGIVHGLYHDLTFEEYLLNAVKLGALNAAMIDVCNVSNDALQMFRENISIDSVGKKMKTIDVTPTI